MKRLPGRWDKTSHIKIRKFRRPSQVFDELRQVTPKSQAIEGIQKAQRTNKRENHKKVISEDMDEIRDIHLKQIYVLQSPTKLKRKRKGEGTR
ncbi:hypothetical protein C922_05335 [Plasmodium inui San Antonio 1]|uniref:Uncharacterized protein n=1 Tax=Plasmodium inui San Antonio 1 TaxID=1237626 RepID=W6ZYB6_9APIC|nr:hypothetical protein C922_05335 [Plasmodium inui San Antonio 1]EUD64290.1 hypothetical protein C922_05335 [Plasmodium inui San Antonio 1]